MLHQVPRFLAMRRGAGEAKVALLVFDGLAMDQWVQIREHVGRCAPTLVFAEGACFSWLPTLTAVSDAAAPFPLAGIRFLRFLEDQDL